MSAISKKDQEILDRLHDIEHQITQLKKELVVLKKRAQSQFASAKKTVDKKQIEKLRQKISKL